MHPLSVCGARVAVRHVDGRRSMSTFPTRIPPWPPFMQVRALRHEWAPGRWAGAELLGDLFETEDQRNNGDASFKTYSRSNLAPRPYTLDAGVVLRQSAVWRLEGAPLAPAGAGALTLTVGAPVGALPPIGIQIEAADTAVPVLLDVLARSPSGDPAARRAQRHCRAPARWACSLPAMARAASHWPPSTRAAARSPAPPGCWGRQRRWPVPASMP